MTIDEAIKNLQSWLDEQKIFPDSDLAHSLALSIEALKELLRIRAEYGWPGLHNLPGETEEVYHDH